MELEIIEIIKETTIKAICISEDKTPYYVQITKSGHSDMYNVIYEDPSECKHEFLSWSELLKKHPDLSVGQLKSLEVK